MFFRDNPIPIKIKWYRAADDAKMFPDLHRFNHLAWYSRPWEATGVGEVYGTPERYSNNFTPPSACGSHYFGKLDDFKNGAAFDPLNDTARDVWGIPLACGCEPDRFVLLEPAYHPVMLMEDGGFIQTEN